MKYIFHILVLFLVSWIAYTTGYNGGLRASPEYVKMRNDDRAARDSRWAANDLTALDLQEPDVEECLPVMNLFEQDIMGYCNQIYMEYEEGQSAAQEAEDRSQYD